MSIHYNRLTNVTFFERILEKESDENEDVYESLDLFSRDYIFVKQLNSLIALNSKVLDLGCGSGKILLMLAQLRPDLFPVGKDISVNMLYKAKKNQQNIKLKNEIDWIKGKIGKEISLGGKFDFIYCHYVSHHLDNISLLLEEIEKRLYKTGKFYIKDFLRPKNSSEARAHVESISSPFLTEKQQSIHYDSLHASFSFEEVEQAVSVYKNKLVYNLKKSKYFWELTGYKNE